MAETLEISSQKRKLLDQYLQQRSEEAIVAGTIPRCAPGAVIPLTLAQQQVWLHAQLAPELPVYNEPFTVHRKGRLDVIALERSFTEIIRRHEAWRTTFAIVDGQPVQVVHPSFEIKLPVVDLRNLPGSERVPAALQLATEDARQPFDLAKLPLLRAHLVRLADEEYRLFVNCHHLIFDGAAGYQVFLPELVSLYHAFANSKPSFSGLSSSEPCGLPELPFQYADYAVWQRESLNREAVKRRVEYWCRQLGGSLPVLQLPTDRPRAAVETFRGAMRSFTLSRQLSEDLRRLSRQQGVTLFMTLLAALDTLLYRVSGQEDIVVGSITAGRDYPGTEKLLGLFLNTVVLRTDLTGEPTFRELLNRVRKTTIEALSNDGVPLDQVLKELHLARDRSRNPLFRVLMSLEPSLSELEPGWNLTPIDVETGTSKFDLCFVLDDRSDGLFGRMIYSTDLFDAATIARFVECWQTLLQAVVRDPGARISHIPILPERERRLIVEEWNATEAEYSNERCIQELFEEQVERTPQAVAVAYEEISLRYAELNVRANQLAHYLRELGVRPDERVAICMERSLETVVGLLAVLKAGGAYVPLDPAYPVERLRYMLEDSAPVALLTQGHLAGRFVGISERLPVLDLKAARAWSGQPESNLDRAVMGLTPEHLAYIIYTSGSTGQPKGVMVPHRAIERLALNNNYAKFEASDRVAFASNPAFDAATMEVWAPLLNGGRIVVIGQSVLLDPVRFGQALKKHRVTVLWLTVGLFNQYADALAEEFSTLRYLIVGGDALDPRVIARVLQGKHPQHLLNGYGPTETTTFATTHEITVVSEKARSIPIGRPIANTRIYILDDHGEPVPVGVVGELHIGGAGVARGYLNQPELTAERFLKDPFVEQAGARMYRTGDLGRWLNDGTIEFLGRNDFQVKVRGFRIELGEIEAQLAEHPAVREAVVIAREDTPGDKRLAAYYTGVQTSQRDASVTVDMLRAHLRARLPEYMVPAGFVRLESLPLTPNGKLDRKALPALGADAYAVHGYEAPQGEVETALASICADLLKLERIGRDDNFFDLGGHSLLAAKLLYCIKKEFGRALSLAFVFQAPTIKLMADGLRSPDQSLRARAIVEIQPKGSQLPLFWVRGGPRFRLLAQKLGLDQPFLGLDIPFSDAIKLPTPYRIEDVASFLVQAMREVQPHGPYLLAGLCMNAAVAYEMARQLQLQGKKIALLAMFDGHNHAFYKNPLRDGRYTGRIKYHLANMVRFDMRAGSAYILDRLEEARRKLKRTIWQLSSDRGDSGADKMPNGDALVYRAFHRYEPQAYPGKMVLFQSTDWPKGAYFDFALGWKDLVQGGIDFHRIPGNHPSMFTEPNVNLVAARLKEHLSEPGPKGH